MLSYLPIKVGSFLNGLHLFFLEHIVNEISFRFLELLFVIFFKDAVDLKIVFIFEPFRMGNKFRPGKMYLSGFLHHCFHNSGIFLFAGAVHFSIGKVEIFRKSFWFFHRMDINHVLHCRKNLGRAFCVTKCSVGILIFINAKRTKS